MKITDAYKPQTFDLKGYLQAKPLDASDRKKTRRKQVNFTEENEEREYVVGDPPRIMSPSFTTPVTIRPESLLQNEDTTQGHSHNHQDPTSNGLTHIQSAPVTDQSLGNSSDDVTEYMNSLYSKNVNSGVNVETGGLQIPVQMPAVNSVPDAISHQDVRTKENELEQFIVRRPRNAAQILEARQRHTQYRFNPEHMHKALGANRKLSTEGEGDWGLREDPTAKTVPISMEQYLKFKTDNKQTSSFDD